MALVGNILLGTGAAPVMSSIASAYAESAASSNIPWSALEYSEQTITAISGSAIGGQGGTDSAKVSAIASAYAESAASGKLDNSASGLWYPLTGNPSGFLTGVDLSPYAYASSVSSKVDQSAFDNCCSSMSSVVSSLETSVTSMSSVVSGLTGDYLEKSASSMFQPSGDYQTAGDYAYNSALSSKLDASASSQFAPSGDYADQSALSSYVPVSASGQFAPSGDYAYNSALSAKLDTSAFTSYTATAAGSTYTSPSATIDIDNEHGTMEATRYAIRHLPAVSATWSLRAVDTTAALDYPPTLIPGRSATLTFTDISGATQFMVSGLKSNDTAVYTYIGSGTSVDIPSSISDLLYILGDHLGWSANVTISAAEEPDRVEPILYKSDRFIDSISMHSAGYPYIVGLNKWPISAAKAVDAQSADYAFSSKSAWHADYAMSAVSATKSVSSTAALQYFTGPGSSTAFISSLENTYAYADSKITAINGSAIDGGATYGYEYGKITAINGSAIAGDGGTTYTSPSGTVAIDNENGTLEIWNSAIAVTEHVTAGQSSFLGSSDSIWKDIYQSGVEKPAIPAGTNILYRVQLLDPLSYPESAYSLEIRFTGDGAKTYVVSATDVHFPSAEGYTGSAMFSSDMNISTLSFHINASESWYPTASASVSASSIAYPQTAYETSVQELALARQVPPMSAWQSLTAWAVAQGWTP